MLTDMESYVFNTEGIFFQVLFFFVPFWVLSFFVLPCLLLGFSSCLVASVVFWLLWLLWLRFRSFFVYPIASLKRPGVRLESK